MSTLLPPPPYGAAPDSYVWLDWYNKYRATLNTTATQVETVATDLATLEDVVEGLAGGGSGIPIGATLPATGNEGDLFFNTTDGKLYRYHSGAWTAAVATVDLVGEITAAQIADAAINVAKFATGIEPVTIVSSVPVTLSTQSIFNTSDGKLYRWNGSEYVATVPAVDITGQLTDSQLADIAAAKLTGQITTTQIADNAISTPKLAAGSVTSAIIAADTITADNIAANAITATELSAGAVTTTKLAAGAVTANELAANSVIVGKVAAGAISTDELAANAVNAGKIAADAITSDKILANAITAGKIATDAVTSDKIAANAITSDKILANAIIAGKILAGTIGTTELAADAVTAEKINVTNLAAVNTNTGALTVTGSLTVSTSGNIKSGKTAYATGTGWIIEYNTGTPRLDIGSDSAYLRWDGSELLLKNATTSGVKNPIPGTSAINVVVGATGTAEAFITFNTNGTVTATGGTTVNWYNPTTTNIGSSTPYYVRIRRIAGSGLMRYSGSTTEDTGWIALTSARAVSAINTDARSPGTSSTYYWDAFAEIALDAAGTNVLGSGVFRATATRTNPPA